MAKYKGREVRIIREIPHSQGDQVAIEHLETPSLNEIVPRSEIIVTKEELATQQKVREETMKPDEFKVEEVKVKK